MKDLPEQLSFVYLENPIHLLTVNEIFEKANQPLLQELKEDRRIERKPATYQAKALGDYFSMFANTKPDGGIIVIGQDNNGAMSGCSHVGQNHINDLERTADNHCSDARYELKRIRVSRPDGKEDFAMLMRVFYRHDKLVRTHAHEAFIRVGESKKKLSEEEAREIEIDKGQLDLEQEPCTLEYPQEFDMELIRQFTNNFKTRRGLDESHSIEQVLKLNHLGKIQSGKFIPNNACALLFAKDPRSKFAGCKIRFLRFDGEDERTGERWNVVKDTSVEEGSIPRQIVAIEKILEAQIREFSRLGTDGIFYTAPEYPKPAWYEAVVNACVHRSYGQKSMNIFVKMFDDRLVIESPGGFPPLVTPENIYEMHQPRNPYLMAALFYLDFVKCANEGTLRMKHAMTAMNLPSPEFAQKEINYGLVRVILRNNIKHRKVWIDKDASAVVGAVISSTLDEHERRVINFIAEHIQISVSQAQRLTGKSWPAASKMLKGLKERGILEDKRNPALKDRDPGARYILKGRSR
jgi:Predicted transcriptional regulator containing an HTH domain and an uncharacterized domain shared with the mammalian protein Schlafen